MPARPDTLADLLALPAEVAARRWAEVQAWMAARFGRDAATLEGTLFLIGVQAAGGGYEPRMERDRKEQHILDASFLVFEAVGGYARAGMEADGAWLWARTDAWPDALDAEAQERLLQLAVHAYLRPFLAEAGPAGQV